MYNHIYIYIYEAAGRVRAPCAPRGAPEMSCDYPGVHRVYLSDPKVRKIGPEKADTLKFIDCAVYIQLHKNGVCSTT